MARPRLTRMLWSVPGGGVGLLVAPAGSGKSVLLEQSVDHGEACWLRISDTHNDASILARNLTEVLHQVNGAFSTSIADLTVHGGGRLGSAFVDAMVAELADLTEPVLLVLEDVHLVTDADILEDLGHLLLELPANARAFVSSRWDLPLGLARMRLMGELVELRTADLAFRQDEALALLEQALGRPVTGAQVGALVDRTEGWAAGLRLAALSMATVTDLDDFIKNFAGDDRLVIDYLSTMILRGLDERRRSFLLRISVLDWATPELCTAVTDEVDASRFLHHFMEHGLFLTRTGGPAGRYRFHQLFADVLRYQLAAEDPIVEVECCRRAAEWLLEHGEYAAAVDQLLAVGDSPAAFAVLSDKGHLMFERGATASLVRGLSRLTDVAGEVGADVRIHLLGAQVSGDEYAAAAENYRELSLRNDLTPGQWVAIDTMASVLAYAHLPLAEVDRLTDGILRSLREVDRASVPSVIGLGGADSCEAMAAGLSALGYFLAGDLDASAQRLQHTMDLPGATYPPWRVVASGMLAMVRCWQGRLTEAEGLASAAVDTARDIGAMDHPSVVWSQLALAMVHLDRLEVGAAEMQLEAASEGVGRCRRPVYDQFLHIVRVRHLAATQGAEAALAHLASAAPHGQLRPVVQQTLSCLHAQLLVRAGSLRQAQRLLGNGKQAGPAASIDVLVAGGDLEAARVVLRTWEPPVSDLRALVARDLRRAVVAHHEGRTGVAGTLVADAAVRADVEGLLEPFVETPLVLNLLRTAAPVRRLRRVRVLLGATPTAHPQARSAETLVEELTPRELLVLEYLPSRLSNDQIADALYVSVNTLKTHLRNIYRKLDASGRDAAVLRAADLGL